MKLHLSEQITDENKTLLKNNFQVSTSGLTLFSNDLNPLKLTYNDGTISTLQLISWSQDSDSSFTIDFSENTHLSFYTADSEQNILSVSVQLPTNTHRIIIPYKLGGAYTVTDYNPSYALINSQKDNYILKGQNITASTLSLTTDRSVALYDKSIESKTFTFDNILGYPLATASSREASIASLKAKILNDYPFKKDLVTSEIAIMAWIAEKSIQGDYLRAIEMVPKSFKNSSSRTYLTTTYFNSLQEMNKSLEMQIENISFSMLSSISNKTLNVFELDAFPDYLLTKTSASINKILAIPSNMENFNPTVSQAAGILHVYNKLETKKPKSAALLENILQPCIEIIESHCVATATSLTIIEHDVKLSDLITVKTGYELLEVGKTSQNKTLIAAGNLLINSSLANNSDASMRTLGEQYRILCSGTNTYYPHVAILEESKNGIIWAWTCAQSITFTKADTNIDTIKCTFPEGASHYMIIHGITEFNAIEIYGLKFRTDPRFEWYNSSGYAVDTANNILFLKFKQKANTETVRLFY